MKTYKFKLYQHKRNRFLHRSINAAGSIYNYCIALHKRYYKMFGKYLNKNRLMKHIAKLRKGNSYWQLVGSQATQDVVQRIDKADQLFFKHSKRGVRPPNFKKNRKYKSLTLKQAGYKFLKDNQLKIGKKVYRFWKSREIEGKIKTVTIKRNPLGELFIFVVTNFVDEQNGVMTSKIVGFDFGIRTFLSISDGSKIVSPLFLKQSLNELRVASKNHSYKKPKSANKERARKNLVRVHEKVVNRRSDWFWKLAHPPYVPPTRGDASGRGVDYLFFETLNLKGMQRLWGRKVNDLAFANFLEILKFVAQKKGKTIAFVDQWYPSSKTCSNCNHKLDKLPLEIRRWRCTSCQSENDRDRNAAINIKRVGASTLGLGDVRQSCTAIPV